MFRSKEEQFDFYWKEIFDGLAYNPIEFNTYRFDQTMSLPGKVNKLYELFKVLAMNNQEVMDYLKEFVETFDFKLETTIKDILIVWLNEGLLTDVVREAISEEVIEARTDYLDHTYLTLKERLDIERKEVILARGMEKNLKDRLDSDKDEFNTRLQQIDGFRAITEKEFTELCSKNELGEVTNWSPAFEYAFSNYNYINIPNGVYHCENEITVSNNEFLRVEGLGLATLIFPNSSGINLSKNIVVNMEGFQIVGKTSDVENIGETFGLKISCNRYSTFKGMRVRGFGIGIDFQSNKFSMNFDTLLIEYNKTGIAMQNANNNNLFLNCTIENNIIGVDCCVKSAGNSTTYNNQFKGGAIQFNKEYGITVRKAEHIQLDLYFEGNGKAHVKLESSVANIESYLYGGNGLTNIDMLHGIELVNSFITLYGRSWKHIESLVFKDEQSVLRSGLRRQEATLTNSWVNVVEETLDKDPKTRWNKSELIDSNWYRTDSEAKITLNSDGSIRFNTGGEAINFEDAKIVNYSGVKVRWANAIPERGTHNIGDIYYNTEPKTGKFVGWVCVASGVPGDWKGFGLIE